MAVMWARSCWGGGAQPGRSGTSGKLNSHGIFDGLSDSVEAAKFNFTNHWLVFSLASIKLNLPNIKFFSAAMVEHVSP